MDRNGNRHNSKKEQVLYVLYDHKEKFIWYFGITDEKIGIDDLTKRIRTHIKKGNRYAGFTRYSARIIRRKINGRLRGRAIEDDAIRYYRAKYGEAYPKGNVDHPFLSKAERAIHDAMIKLEEE